MCCVSPPQPCGKQVYKRALCVWQVSRVCELATVRRHQRGQIEPNRADPRRGASATVSQPSVHQGHGSVINFFISCACGDYEVLSPKRQRFTREGSYLLTLSLSSNLAGHDYRLGGLPWVLSTDHPFGDNWHLGHQAVVRPATCWLWMVPPQPRRLHRWPDRP